MQLVILSVFSQNLVRIFSLFFIFKKSKRAPMEHVCARKTCLVISFKWKNLLCINCEECKSLRELSTPSHSLKVGGLGMTSSEESSCTSKRYEQSLIFFSHLATWVRNSSIANDLTFKTKEEEDKRSVLQISLKITHMCESCNPWLRHHSLGHDCGYGNASKTSKDC